MFNLFKRNKDTFPTEIEEGNVYIDGDRLYYQDHGYEESVDLVQLKYAYVEILGNRPFLFLFDWHQHYICCLQQGFVNAYKKLSERFGFDDDAFFKITNSKKEQKQRIWIQSQGKNYRILHENHDDYNEGFEILSTPPQFISWDTSYKDIKKLNVGTLYKSNYDIDYYKFNYRVRIGSLIIDELEFVDDNDRKEIAVQSFFATLNGGKNTDESYKELRKLWMDEIPTDVDDAGYERRDQKYLYFDLGGISLSICYTYDEDQYEDGCTSLSISNYRDYTAIILHERNDLKPEFTEIITFKAHLQFMPDYRSNSKVTAKPRLIETLAGHKQSVYFNNETNRFGFTSDQYAIEYTSTEVEQIIIQNVLPAKGGGYAELSIKLFGQDYGTTIFYANQNELDEYAQLIENLLGIQVIMPEPYYNC
jgi:hypothetical protein